MSENGPLGYSFSLLRPSCRRSSTHVLRAHPRSHGFAILLQPQYSRVSFAYERLVSHGSIRKLMVFSHLHHGGVAVGGFLTSGWDSSQACPAQFLQRCG